MSGSNAKPPKELATLFQMTMGLVVSQSLYVAADLGIADHFQRITYGARSRRKKRLTSRRLGASSSRTCGPWDNQT
jgi:hypothetical protein